MADERHRKAIDDLLLFLNSFDGSPYILKGGTALMECYGLDRESEDIDLDAPGRGVSKSAFFKKIDLYCQKRDYSYRIGKDTDTVQRVFLNYGAENRPLKVELSYRRANIPEQASSMVNGIRVYGINELTMMKSSAYLARDKIRDLYDLSFICRAHFDELSPAAVETLRNAFEYKDLDQFDYMVRTQPDPLIDPDKLEEMFLEAFDKLGLLSLDDSSGDASSERGHASELASIPELAARAHASGAVSSGMHM